MAAPAPPPPPGSTNKRSVTRPIIDGQPAEKPNVLNATQICLTSQQQEPLIWNYIACLCNILRHIRVTSLQQGSLIRQWMICLWNIVRHIRVQKRNTVLNSMDYEKHMGLTLLQMNFILGASSMDRVSRVILTSMAIQCWI